MRYRIIAVFVLLISLSPPAMAYLDPASGSAIMSAIIGLIVAIFLAVKTYWYKMKSIFVKTPPTDKKENLSNQENDITSK